MFHSTRFFFVCDFLSKKFEKNFKFSGFFNFWDISLLWMKFKHFRSKVLRTFYNRVKLFFKWLSNFGDILMFIFRKREKFEKFAKKRRVLQCRPAKVCLRKSSLVSMCSPLRARFNTLRRFYHTQLVEEISSKYRRKSVNLKHSFPIL